MLFKKDSFDFGIIAYNEDYKWLETRKLDFKSNRNKEDMVEDWHKQYDEFIYEKDLIPFFLGGQINDDEIFVVDNFELPTYLQELNISTIPDQNPVNRDDIRAGIFRGIIGTTIDDENSDQYLRQLSWVKF